MAIKSTFKVTLLAGALLLGGVLFLTRKPSTSEESGRVSRPEAGQPQLQSREKLAEKVPTKVLSAEDLQKKKILNEILQSKNDNDQRLDQDLRALSPELKRELEREYQNIPSENRNDRGTIVFLLGREIKNPQDLEFIKTIFTEDPCLSLENCKTTIPEDPHLSFANETTLAYPQIVGLVQIENYLKKNPNLLKDDKWRAALSSLLLQAESYRVPKVQEKASRIRQGLEL